MLFPFMSHPVSCQSFSENIKGQIDLVFFQIFPNFLVKFVLYLQSLH